MQASVEVEDHRAEKPTFMYYISLIHKKYPFHCTGQRLSTILFFANFFGFFNTMKWTKINV